MKKAFFGLILMLCIAFACGATAEENWSAEADVVVIGAGAAGQSAALAAAEEGASVLVLEKAPYSAAGGNSRVCGQQILAPTDVEKAVSYFETLSDGFAHDSALIRATVEAMTENGEWLKAITGKELDLQDLMYPEYPEVEGSDSMRCYLIEGKRTPGLLWGLLNESMEARNDRIQIWYDSPALELIQDESGMITGVKASHEGETISVKAKNGVVMACGGYENNLDMIQEYYHLPYAYPKGSIYNTGDGVIMAQKVGAALWHMNNPSGPDLNFKDPDSNVYYGYSLAMTLGSRSTIFVGPDGTRFINEAQMTRHGKLYTHGVYQTAQIVLPAYAVFDEAAFTAGPITTSGGWSQDNLAELEKGFILKADTLAELAEKIGVDAANLEKSVQRYNYYCSVGEDWAFGRDAGKLMPISENGPYYAMELTPTLTNTQGGAVRNANCEVVDLDGYAIPHLYSAGEFGSMYVNGYNGGGNVGEALATGRIAGANAAKADKSGIPVLSTGKQHAQSENQPAAHEAVSYADGVYTGTGTGMGGQLTVEVTVENEKITAVSITEIHDTAGIFESAVEQMPQRIIQAQSIDVDTVAGATMTSRGILEAVQAALTNAIQ